MSQPGSHIYDDLEQVVADVEAQVAKLRAQADDERAQAENPADPADEHNAAAAVTDFRASEGERAIAMYHDSVARLRQYRAGGQQR